MCTYDWSLYSARIPEILLLGDSWKSCLHLQRVSISSGRTFRTLASSKFSSIYKTNQHRHVNLSLVVEGVANKRYVALSSFHWNGWRTMRIESRVSYSSIEIGCERQEIGFRRFFQKVDSLNRFSKLVSCSFGMWCDVIRRSAEIFWFYSTDSRNTWSVKSTRHFETSLFV